MQFRIELRRFFIEWQWHHLCVWDNWEQDTKGMWSKQRGGVQVCAEGQVTYISACHALADHAIILSPGACDESNRKPAACTVNCFRAAPVCGSDGVTYWCGAAEAQCAGVEVAHEGYCEIWKVSDEVGSTGSHAAQSLQLVHMVLLLLAGLLIVGGLAWLQNHVGSEP